MIHDAPHSHANRKVKLNDGHDFWLEDWWDRVSGKSWRMGGPIAAIQYAARAGWAGLPLDDEVVYGKVNGLGYLIHVSELALE